jgi:hypothetical protein
MRSLSSNRIKVLKSRDSIDIFMSLGIVSASSCSLAGRYDNHISIQFLALNWILEPYSLAGRYDNPIPTKFLAPTDYSKIPALVGFQHIYEG